LIEKRQEIGDPVRCAEGTGKVGLSEFIEPDPRWICAEVTGARIFAPDGTCVELNEKMAGKEVGYVLERKIFDRAVAKTAAKAGAEVQVKTQATSLIKENGAVCGIRGKHRGDDVRGPGQSGRGSGRHRVQGRQVGRNKHHDKAKGYRDMRAVPCHRYRYQGR